MLTAEEFRARREKDLSYINARPYIDRWEIQDPDSPLLKYAGPVGILEWWDYDEAKPFTHYLPSSAVDPLITLSASFNTKVFRELHNGPYAYRQIDILNAVDYTFQKFYPIPERMRVKSVLDFGAGYGRHANLWTQLCPDITYVAVDSIERSYCLQSFYLGLLDPELTEYVVVGDEFRIEQKPGIFHVPGWRTDLLPEGFFDLVICTDVLPEVPGDLVIDSIMLFRHALKASGAVYFRDHDVSWQPVHRLDYSALMHSTGFQLEFRPVVNESMKAADQSRVDIHGMPRVWRKLS